MGQESKNSAGGLASLGNITSVMFRRVEGTFYEVKSMSHKAALCGEQSERNMPSEPTRLCQADCGLLIRLNWFTSDKDSVFIDTISIV